MRLDEVQTQFKNLMLDHPDALDAPEAAFAAQFETGRIALPRRLKVYRHNIVGSLTDLMIATFPLLEKLVGHAFLEGMARSFVLQHPPERGALSLYGAGFDDFIRAFELAKGLPYLPDVATFELAMNAAYYAPDGMALQAEDLTAFSPEALNEFVPILAPHVRLISSPYPILAIKEFCDADAEGTLDMDQGAVHLMVARPALDVQIGVLDAGEFMALSLFQEGGMLGTSVEAVMSAYPEFDFQAFLQKHLALETFAAIPANDE